MTLSPACARFLMTLTAQVAATTATWGAGRNPDVLVGMCPRMFPVNARGQVVLSMDERLWASGRLRYGVR